MQKRRVEARLGERGMTIGEYLRLTDKYTYRELLKLCNKTIDKPKKEVKLGDRPEKLMQHDSYKRQGRRIRQKSWS